MKKIRWTCAVLLAGILIVLIVALPHLTKGAGQPETDSIYDFEPPEWLSGQQEADGRWVFYQGAKVIGGISTHKNTRHFSKKDVEERLNDVIEYFFEDSGIHKQLESVPHFAGNSLYADFELHHEYGGEDETVCYYYITADCVVEIWFSRSMFSQDEIKSCIDSLTVYH